MLIKFTKGPLKAEAFREILVRLVLSSSKPILLVVERRAIYNSKLIMEYVEAQKDRLKLFYIPAPK